MARLHVVDGTYELFRAHFSKRPGHTSPGGVDLKATVGLASSMLALLHDEQEAVTHFAVAFDNPIRSFRNALFDGYKTDEGVPPELLAQFDAAEEAMRAIGAVVWSMGEWETDDALATAAHRFAREVEQVRIIASDKDLMQCVRGTDVVLVDRQRQRVFDEAAVKTHKGVPPRSIPDLLALVGDDADGIPGLQGFGEKGAAALLSAFGSIEAVPLDPAKWPRTVRGAPRLCATLEKRMTEALLYKRLATLVTDVPLAESLKDLSWGGVPRARWEEWCEATGVTTMKSRPTRWQG